MDEQELHIASLVVHARRERLPAVALAIEAVPGARVHASAPSVQVQPEPLSAVAVSPPVSVSVTVTVPLVAALPLFRAVSV